MTLNELVLDLEMLLAKAKELQAEESKSWRIPAGTMSWTPVAAAQPMTIIVTSTGNGE